MGKARILVVEDRFIVAEDIAATLRKLGYEVPETVMSGEEAIERAKVLQPDLVLMDIHLKGAMDGITAAEQLRKRYDIPVVYLTAHSDDSTLQRASATEPLGYLLKPFEERQLYTTVELAVGRWNAGRRRDGAVGGAEAPASAPRRPEFAHIVGQHPVLLALLHRVELVAKTDVTAHIYGENGTGKELIADAIHRVSSRRERPFVKLNCSAIPATLLESALFGHIKGAFTGATRDQQGFVEHAEGGTLFLDEIGDLSSDIQLKLLRLLQSREYSRVGETTLRKTDVRIITATNQDLKELVRSGKIREDFFYRIHVFPLVVPPLRDRSSDILLLADHFRGLFNRTFNKSVSGFTPAAEKALQSHTWPGNVRELENAVRHAFVVVPDDGTIDREHLPPDVLQEAASGATVGPAAADLAGLAPDDAERRTIVNALERCGGNRTKAAKILGYSRVTLWKRMTRLGLDKAESSEPEDSSNPS